jgi:hypothetical protein
MALPIMDCRKTNQGLGDYDFKRLEIANINFHSPRECDRVHRRAALDDLNARSLGELLQRRRVSGTVGSHDQDRRNARF